MASTIEKVKNPQGSEGNSRSQIGVNDDDEGWTLVTRMRREKKILLNRKKMPKRSKIVKQSNKKPKPKMTKKKVTQSKCKRAFRQKPRKPITLNEYMQKSSEMKVLCS